MKIYIHLIEASSNQSRLFNNRYQARFLEFFTRILRAKNMYSAWMVLLLHNLSKNIEIDVTRSVDIA